MLRAASTALLLAWSARAAQLRPAAPTEACTGEECLEVLDHLHSTEACAKKKPSFYMKCAPAGRSVYRMECERGEGGCALSFEDPTAALQASLQVSGSAQRDLLSTMVRTGTDKVSTHHYSPLYQKWTGHLSTNDTKPFTFLEVGFSTGRSARAWANFFPSADVHEIEVSCDQFWNSEWTNAGGASGPHRDLGYCRLHCGDASQEDFLEESLRGVEAPLVAVDDGGHGPKEMRLFFRHMWPRLRPGGLLFVEDLAESYEVGNGFVETTAKPLLRDLMGLGSSEPELFADLSRVECREQICVFEKARKQ